MNHGKCTNCWWYKMQHGDAYKVIGSRIIKTEGNGICYMHTVNPATDTEDPHYVDGGSWCPDYTNRVIANKRDKMTLEAWLNKFRTVKQTKNRLT